MVGVGNSNLVIRQRHNGEEKEAEREEEGGVAFVGGGEILVAF